jgi:hypothetical protein
MPHARRWRPRCAGDLPPDGRARVAARVGRRWDVACDGAVGDVRRRGLQHARAAPRRAGGPERPRPGTDGRQPRPRRRRVSGGSSADRQRCRPAAARSHPGTGDEQAPLCRVLPAWHAWGLDAARDGHARHRVGRGRMHPARGLRPGGPGRNLAVPGDPARRDRALRVARVARRPARATRPRVDAVRTP